MDRQEPLLSLPHQIKDLVLTSTNQYQVQLKHFLLKETRVKKLELKIPKSIQFKAKLNAPKGLNTLDKQEFLTLQDKFQNSLDEDIGSYHSLIKQAAALELRSMKQNLESIRDDFIKELSIMCVAILNCTQRTTSCTLENFEAYFDFAPTPYACLLYTEALDCFDTEVKLKKRNTEVEFALHQLSIQKKAQLTADVMDLSNDLPKADLVSTLVDKKIKTKLTQLQLKVASLEKLLKGQAGHKKKDPVTSRRQVLNKGIAKAGDTELVNARKEKEKGNVKRTKGKNNKPKPKGSSHDKVKKLPNPNRR
jgi:hypothetical protein